MASKKNKKKRSFWTYAAAAGAAFLTAAFHGYTQSEVRALRGAGYSHHVERKTKKSKPALRRAA